MRKFMLRAARRMVLTMLIVLDVLIDFFSGGGVQTISCRAGKALKAGSRWAIWLCRFLDEAEPNHCENAVKDPTGGI